MHPHVITDTNANEHYGVRACTFAGQTKSADCGGPWFTIPTTQVRVANALAPHVCVCAYHLKAALDAVSPPAAAPKPRRQPRRSPEKREELSL